jgi:hypothetical protein
MRTIVVYPPQEELDEEDDNWMEKVEREAERKYEYWQMRREENK